MLLLIDDIYDFILYERGEDITYNGITKKALLLDSSSEIHYEDDKEIITDFQTKTGDMLQYQGYDWFIVGQVDKHQNFKTYRSRIRKVEQLFKKIFDGVVKEIPCIIECGNQGIKINQYINAIDGKIKVVLQDNEITQKLTYDDTFIKMGAKWKITGFSTEEKGLRYLYCTKIEFDTVNDDIIGEIADKGKWIYTIAIAEAPTATVYLGNTLQLTVSVLLNGNPTSKTVLYTSSDSTKATVSQTGEIIPIAKGDCVITASIIDIPEVQCTIAINVDELIVDNFTYTLTGTSSPDTECKLNSTQTYTAKKFNNGVQVPTATFTFSVIPGTTTPDKYTFATVNTTQATIKTLSYTYYITLRATDTSDGTKYVEKNIKLRGVI